MLWNIKPLECTSMVVLVQCVIEAISHTQNKARVHLFDKVGYIESRQGSLLSNLHHNGVASC